jgi:hypothetical protein
MHTDIFTVTTGQLLYICNILGRFQLHFDQWAPAKLRGSWNIMTIKRTAVCWRQTHLRIFTLLRQNEQQEYKNLIYTRMLELTQRCSCVWDMTTCGRFRNVGRQWPTDEAPYPRTSPALHTHLHCPVHFLQLSPNAKQKNKTHFFRHPPPPPAFQPHNCSAVIRLLLISFSFRFPALSSRMSHKKSRDCCFRIIYPLLRSLFPFNKLRRLF